MFHKQLKVPGPVGHRLPRRAHLDLVVRRRAVPSAAGVLRLETNRLRATARVNAYVRLVRELRLHGMRATVIDLGADELLVTGRAPEFLEPSKHLPEDLRPCDLLRPEEHHELIYVPVFITLVLGYCIAVEVDVDVSFLAWHPLSLVASVQLSAVDAAM